MRKLTQEEINRLCQFFLLLDKIDRRLKKVKEHHGKSTLFVPYLKKSSCTPRILLHDAPSSPYFGISLYGHIKFSKTKKNPIRKNG